MRFPNPKLNRFGFKKRRIGLRKWIKGCPNAYLLRKCDGKQMPCSHGHAGIFCVVVGLQIDPALRIGAKEDAQAQVRARVNEENFAGHAVSLFDNTYHSLIIAA